ncbi:Aste57867_20310 [Aphanomyces stellatus]|uniref:Aste57867_20310 protein n=1 Tax=Aphanomyces stellatus TaxID=120398 RepID=A0A485LEP5_9STRA|nr:hypothetical protein As57867_020244 [Aphanomyces stellatus]KAF0701527.1 hypothetical protein As57867_007994 [Aphanomyces stellatus]VFT84917.1 Aste57867_8024 [Aphanomyces stellatus]VFT96999.1 Aste57867_20310 [Aphanomyces stellatus]
MAGASKCRFPSRNDLKVHATSVSVRVVFVLPMFMLVHELPPTKHFQHPKKEHTEINAGIYVVRNKKTGHAYFGSTWDLGNAQSQNWADLSHGIHAHQAMVRTVKMYGLGDISFHVLQRIPTAKEFHFRELEELLQTKLTFHIARAQHIHAVRVFRTWQHHCFSLVWPKWKSCVQYEKQIETDAAAVEIQRIVRGAHGRHLAQHVLRQNAATTIQRHTRGSAARRRVRAERHTRASQRIQRSWRFFSDRRRWQKTKGAARLVQRVFRGYLGRKKCHTMKLSRRHEAAAQCLQRNLRLVHCSRKWRRQRKQRLETEASVVIQRVWRGKMGRDRAETASVIRESVRERERAALLIQDTFHNYHVKLFQWATWSLVQQCRSVRRIHKAWRDYAARKFGWAALGILLLDKKARVAQRAFRAYRFRQVLNRRCLERRRNRAATSIQRYTRGYVVRTVVVPRIQHLRRQKKSADYVGTWFRAMIWRHLIQFVRKTARATRIQSAFRTHVLRKKFRACKEEWRREKAALRIQCQYRIHRANERVKFKRWLRTTGQCVECQEALAQVFVVTFGLEVCNSCASELGQLSDVETMPISEYRTQQHKATRIAAAYRGFAVRLGRREGICSTCCVRARQMICLTCKETYCHSCCSKIHALSYNKKHVPWTTHQHELRTKAAIRLQSRARVYFHRGTLNSLRTQKREVAATTIQGWWHARYVRHVAFLNMQLLAMQQVQRDDACLFLQRVYRGYCGRLQAHGRRERHGAALVIQTNFRGFVARNLLRKHREEVLEAKRQRAGLIIQCAFRQHLGRQMLHQRREFVASRTIQCMVRVYAAKKILFALQMEYELKVQSAIAQMKQRRKIRAVIQIQSLYRRRRDLRVAVAKRLARTMNQRLKILAIFQFTEKIAANRIGRFYCRRYVFLNSRVQKIQNLVRLHWGRKERKVWKMAQQEKAQQRAVVQLQCFARRIIARRGFLELKKGEWIECLDEVSGNTYYYNSATQETSWEWPREEVLAPQHEPAAKDKTIWVQTWDETYQAYYYCNQVTGETSWTSPSAGNQEEERPTQTYDDGNNTYATN